MEETLKLILEKISNMDNNMKEMRVDINDMKGEIKNIKQDIVRLEDICSFWWLQTKYRANSRTKKGTIFTRRIYYQAC